MKVLIGCEESGVVREAFKALGHDAWSCDLVPSRQPGQHLQMDVAEAVRMGWDLAILHPECTAMALSGNRHYGVGMPKHDLRLKALDWTHRLFIDAVAYCGRVALEQPKSTLRQRLGKRTQEIHPWMFGHPEQKTTWLWLHRLPPLVETNNVHEAMMRLPEKERCKVWYASPSDTRSRDRSVTYQGVAVAMAKQWGSL